MFSQDEVTRLNLLRRRQLEQERKTIKHALTLAFWLQISAVLLMALTAIATLLFPMPWWMFAGLVVVALVLAFWGRRILKKVMREKNS